MTNFWILRPHVEVDMRYLTRHMHLICVQQVRTHVPSLPPISRHLHCVRFLLSSVYLVGESDNPEAVLDRLKLSPVRLLGCDVPHDSTSFSSYVSEESGT